MRAAPERRSPYWTLAGLAVALVVLCQPLSAQILEARAQHRPPPRPPDLVHGTQWCSPDGRHCIHSKRFAEDLCRTIAATAEASGVNRSFFARLIWRESLFDPDAISPAGAQGIAQFIPETAQRRGLDDPFNPAAALQASALYLADLQARFGTAGLAAAAYNAGEQRAESYLRTGRRLPSETRRYVYAITGYSAAEWRDGAASLNGLQLDRQTPFAAACIARAERRGQGGYAGSTPPKPWAAVLAAQSSREAAARHLERLQRRHPDLRRDDIALRPMRLPARAGRQITAQIGADSRDEARMICTDLRRQGAPCMVLKN